MVKVYQELLAEVDGERATFHRLVEWSMKLDAFATEDRSPNGRSPNVDRKGFER